MGLPTILVAEDDRPIADLYEQWLDDEYDVRVAYDGEEAVELIDEDVAVALLDRRMPERTGDEVLDVIRERNLDCRVVMVTAVDPNFDIIEMGFDDYLVKPVSASDLAETVERLVVMSSLDVTFQEYSALAVKRATLRQEMSETELAASAEYADLEANLNTRHGEVNTLLAEFTEDDVEILLRGSTIGTDNVEHVSGD